MKRSNVRRVIIGVLVTASLAGLGIARLVASQTKGDEASWLMLSNKEQSPEGFVPYLKAHPSDMAHRQAALVWYERRKPDYQKLRENTFEMIKYHPNCLDIIWDNTSAFYAHPDYNAEVISRLRREETLGHKEHGFYFVMAKVTEQAAMPPLANSDVSRARFIQYFELPSNTVLRTTIDTPLANSAVDYYRKAVAAAGHENFYPAFYAEDLVSLLVDLKRYDEAVTVCEQHLSDLDDTNKPDYLVTYGSCLHKLHRDDKANKVLSSVRSVDHEGHDNGPGHATMEAEMQLGEMAMDSGDIAGARLHLLASTNVQPCCHNVTRGFPLRLAKRLLAAGQKDAVVQFCTTVLAKFTPNQQQTKELLQSAKAST